MVVVAALAAAIGALSAFVVFSESSPAPATSGAALATADQTSSPPSPTTAAGQGLEVTAEWETDSRGRPILPGSRIIRVSGPETMGTTIFIAGRLIKLPADAYVFARADEVLCIAGDPCPATPLIGIARGGSKISVSGSGEIVFEEVATGEEGAFDFLKEALRP